MLRRANIAAERPPDFKSGMATPGAAAAANLWRNSARTIGDILVLSDIINPYAYYALPFVNQAFFVAGCCYVKGELWPDRMDKRKLISGLSCRDRASPVYGSSSSRRRRGSIRDSPVSVRERQ